MVAMDRIINNKHISIKMRTDIMIRISNSSLSITMMTFVRFSEALKMKMEAT